MLRLSVAVLAAAMISPTACWGQSCPPELGLEVNNKCPNSPPQGWAPGANVPVYIVSTPHYPFTPAQISAIETELTDWNSRLQTLQQGRPPTFNPQVRPTQPSNPTPPYAVFDFGPVDQCVTDYDPDPDACTLTFWSCPPSNGIIDHSITNVKIEYMVADYQLFAHEIGHTFGLTDCTASDWRVAHPFEARPTE